MTNSTTNVVVGKPLATGGALNAPVGTALPTDETTALDVAFKPTGYVSKDGASFTPNRDTSDVQAWGGDTVALIQSKFGVEGKVALIEALNSQALKTTFGSANVVVTAATSTTGTKTATKVTGDELEHLSWVFEIKNGIKKVRVIWADAQVSKVDEIKFTDSDATAYALAATLFPDASGIYVYIYTDDGVTTA